MSHNAFVGSLGNHGRWSIVSRVDIVVEVGDDRRKLLFGLLVEVRYRNTCGKYSIVGVGDSHVCSSLGGLPIHISKQYEKQAELKGIGCFID